MTAITGGVCCLVGELTAHELDLSHLPHCDVVNECTIVKSKKVVIVQFECTSVKIALVANDSSPSVLVGVREEFH